MAKSFSFISSKINISAIKICSKNLNYKSLLVHHVWHQDQMHARSVAFNPPREDECAFRQVHKD